ncbi:MAG: hypothetical protein ABMB14_28470 [Myxococcota bacterium]
MIALLAGCVAPVVTLDDPRTRWLADGWTRIEAPTHLPSGEVGRDAVEVWVRLPDGEAIRSEALADGRTGLVFPAGTVADRVEWRGEGRERRIVDVRGTRLDDDGARTHHVYQPIVRDPDAPLLGVEWPAGDADATAVALDRFVAAVRPHRPDADGWERLYRSKHACDACHVADRPDNTVPGEHGLVNRGTDVQGWFTPSTLLSDTVPGEAYGAWSGDRTDPHVVPSCPEARAGRTCADGAVPRWRLDAAAAVAAGSPHALAHCAAVRWLRDHLAPGDAALADGGALGGHPCLSTDLPQE